MFPVKIALEESVGALKDAIKEKKKQRLREIDADALDLWKVREWIAESIVPDTEIGLW